jgi:hypothetical protein
VQFSLDELRRAIKAAKAGKDVIVLETVNGGKIQTHRVQYDGGNRFPHLERASDAPDYLSKILEPKVTGDK